MTKNSKTKRYTALWYNPIAQEEQNVFVKAVTKEEALKLCGILIECRCSKCNADDIESFEEVKEDYFYDKQDVINTINIFNNSIDINTYELPQSIKDIYLGGD